MIGLGFSPGSAVIMASAHRKAFPAGIANLVAAYDPSDLATVFQNTAGTVAAGVGDPVRLMLDKSGNGRHMRAGSDAARPVLKSSGGLHWLEGDGVDDLMTADGGTLFSTTVYTALACRLLSFSNTFPHVMSHAQANPPLDPATRQPLTFFDSTLPTKLVNTYGTKQVIVDLGSSVVGTDIVMDSYTGATATYLNANGVTLSTTGTALTDTAPEALRIFGNVKTNARFYGAIRTHTIPTTAQQAQIRQWLAEKSGGIA